MMKRLTILAVIVVLSASASAINKHQVQAVSGSPQFSSENCVEAQAYISLTLRKNDLKARVDRTQFYESIQHDLEVLVSRMEKNNQPGAGSLKASVSKLKSEIESFKAHYESYDASREAASKVPECAQNYTKFQTALRSAQSKRKLLSQDIKNIDSLVSLDILDQLDKIEASLKEDSSQGSKL